MARSVLLVAALALVLCSATAASRQLQDEKLDQHSRRLLQFPLPGSQTQLTAQLINALVQNNQAEYQRILGLLLQNHVTFGDGIDPITLALTAATIQGANPSTIFDAGRQAVQEGGVNPSTLANSITGANGNNGSAPMLMDALQNGNMGAGQQAVTDSANANANAQSNGGTTVISQSSASSVAFDALNVTVSEAISTAVAQVRGGGDANAVANSTATTIATACAKAFASTQSSVISTGPGGQGSASAFASANATANATAVSVAAAFSKALGPGGVATAQAVAQSIYTQVRSAIAVASSSATVQGAGQAQAQDTAVAQAIAVATVSSIAQALATVRSAPVQPAGR